MAPFVPDFISEPLNLVIAFLLGIGFGFVLEQAGFSSSRRLAGVFYGYDFTVLRVFFTAAITAMSGTLLLGYYGYLDLTMIFVNPTWLYPAIVGGMIMGVGFVLGGYCPGTSICALAIGKIDALFFVLGGIIGTFLYGEFYPLIQSFVDSSDLGPVFVYDSLGMGAGTFAFILISVALAAFIATSRIEKKIDPSNAPSLSFPKASLRIATLALFVLGVSFLWMPDRKTLLYEEIAGETYIKANPIAMMEMDELAYRLMDNDARMRVLDVRSDTAFARLAIPGSARISEADIFGKTGNELIRADYLLKVVVADTEADASRIARVLSRLGAKRVAALINGFPSFAQTFLTPPPATMGVMNLETTSSAIAAGFYSVGNRGDAVTMRFREIARDTLISRIAAEKAKGVAQPKAPKKVKGGC